MQYIYWTELTIYCCCFLRKHIIVPCINYATWLSISSVHSLHNVQFYSRLKKSRGNIYVNEAAVQCDLWLRVAVNTGDNCLFIPNVIDWITHYFSDEKLLLFCKNYIGHLIRYWDILGQFKMSRTQIDLCDMWFVHFLQNCSHMNATRSNGW